MSVSPVVLVEGESFSREGDLSVELITGALEVMMGRGEWV